MPHSKTIGVVASVDTVDSIEILISLAHSCGLQLVRTSLAETGKFLGLMIVGQGNRLEEKRIALDCSVLRISLSDHASSEVRVTFGTTEFSPLPYRGRTVLADCVRPCVEETEAGDVIANAAGAPVWTSLIHNGHRHDHCWIGRPWVKAKECVFNHLNGIKFMNLLPVMEWMRWVSGWHGWRQPPLRACFMFDDPNFHATRYGYVNYVRLATEGRQHRYHSAFATVPLDAYYASFSAARIVRENPETLSFLIHGNNHTYRELADRHASPANQLAAMHQAVRRIEKLERKTSVKIARVMAPPHGVCSAEMMAAMLGAGFEAVCVSHGSVWTGNTDADWATSLGAYPAMNVSGLPVIPRFGLDQQLENQVLLSAYLNQPIIPIGHHWDLADGIEILASGARIINGLGDVQWGDMTMISRSNYRSRIEKHLMRVQPFSRSVTVRIPLEVTELELEAPWLDLARDKVEIRGRSSSNMPQGQESLTVDSLRVRVSPGTVIDLAMRRVTDPGAKLLPAPRTPVKVIARKILVELRDRAMPYLPCGSIKK